MEIISLSPTTQNEVKRLLNLEVEKNPGQENMGLRVAVQGGGCAGLQYKLAFSTPGEEDLVCEYENGLRVIVDPKSATFLAGTTLEYHFGLDKSGFEVTNPAATNNCGCGKSFGV